jgi:UDP-3-O-[3-hydroxymyristoyl] glucosamine N-acyltransferase
VLGEDTVLGQFCVIGDGVRIGRDCVIGHHVVIHDGVRIGDRARIDDHAVLGKQPMRAAQSAVTQVTLHPPTRLGDGCIVGTGAVIYAGVVLGDDVLVADLATIREEVTIGRCTIVGRGVAVENRCTIGQYCKLETEAYITAYSVLEDRVFVAPGVVTSNDNYVGRTRERFEHFKGVTVRRGGRVGAGATILPGKLVGEDGLVAAGAVVTRDVAARRIVAGVPAGDFGPVPEAQLLENQGWKE